MLSIMMMTLLVLAAVAGLTVTSAALALLLGRVIRTSALNGEWLTDDEADLGSLALSMSPPLTCVELGPRHHLFMTPERRSVERVWKGRTIPLVWDSRLDQDRFATSR